jgi:hypothetical protein
LNVDVVALYQRSRKPDRQAIAPFSYTHKIYPPKIYHQVINYKAN